MIRIPDVIHHNPIAEMLHRGKVIRQLTNEIMEKLGDEQIAVLVQAYADKGYEGDLYGLVESEVHQYVAHKYTENHAIQCDDALVEEAKAFVKGDIEITEKVVRDR